MQKNFLEYVQKVLPGCVASTKNTHTDGVILTTVSKLGLLMYFLVFHTHAQFKLITDATAVDFFMERGRFMLVYNLVSVTYMSRLRVKIRVDDNESVPSLSTLFSGVEWYEREIWGMFGVMFIGNNDLRRMLSDYGFQGHPLRKSFPLTGYYELRYDGVLRRIVQEPVELAQEFRVYDFNRAWSVF